MPYWSRPILRVAAKVEFCQVELGDTMAGAESLLTAAANLCIANIAHQRTKLSD